MISLPSSKDQVEYSWSKVTGAWLIYCEERHVGRRLRNGRMKAKEKKTSPLCSAFFVLVNSDVSPLLWWMKGTSSGGAGTLAMPCNVALIPSSLWRCAYW